MKKRTTMFGYAINSFFNATNPLKNLMNNNNNFWKIWSCIFARVKGLCQFVKMFGFAS
jgi:hypothetical protein